MFSINHSDAIELEFQVRRLYQCERSGISGLAEADYLSHNPIQAAILIIAYIYATKMEESPLKYDQFLAEYNSVFKYPDEYNMDQEIKSYIEKIKDIVDMYCPQDI